MCYDKKLTKRQYRLELGGDDHMYYNANIRIICIQYIQFCFEALKAYVVLLLFTGYSSEEPEK